MIQPFFNADGTGVTLYITIVDVDGNHVDPDSWPITNDPAIILSSHPSAAKVVTKVDDGVYKVVWTGLSPTLTNGQVIHVSVDGTISGTAWSTWIVPIQALLFAPTASANAAATRTELATELAKVLETAIELAKVPKYDDTIKKTVVSDTATELQELIELVTELEPVVPE